MPIETPRGSPSSGGDAESQTFTRRTALKLGAVGIVGAAVGAASMPLLRRMTAAPASPYRHFSRSEAELLTAICDQLIPRDDVAGAGEAGAVDYIDRQLAGPFAQHVSTYRGGLDAFQRTCTAQHGKRFQELPQALQIELLTAVEGNKVPKGIWDKPSAPQFFNLVLAHTMQSFYGSPRHGGNRDFASYRMLGLPLPQVVGRNKPRSS